MNDTKNESKPPEAALSTEDSESATPPDASNEAGDAVPATPADNAAADAAINGAVPSDAAPETLEPIDVAAIAEAAGAYDRAKVSEASDDETDSDDDAPPSVEDQIAELRDRLLRAMAELENTRKRAERDRREASKYALTGFARSILTVADNLRRAIESVPDDEHENETIKTLLAGIEMTERELLKVFDQQGIKSIDPLGEKFDHNFHQAMFEVDAAGQAAGTIVQVMEPGYVIADRLLRPAMVGIAKAQATGDKPGGDAAKESPGDKDLLQESQGESQGVTQGESPGESHEDSPRIDTKV